MNQICKKLVTTQDNLEPLLERGKPTKVQIINGVPSVFRCDLKNALPPIKIKIGQKDEQVSDFLCCYSFVNKNPELKNCEKKYLNQPK